MLSEDYYAPEPEVCDCCGAPLKRKYKTVRPLKIKKPKIRQFFKNNLDVLGILAFTIIEITLLLVLTS